MPRSGLIAIAGRPNAGKSSLLNRILGTKLSIVTPKAQTTRERVLGILTEKRGQIVFVDTPGIHKAKQGGINAFMVQEAKEALIDPSAVWYLVDPYSSILHETTVLELLKEAGTRAPIFMLLNKVDLSGKAGERSFAPWIEELAAKAREMGLNIQDVRRISALDGQGVDALLTSSWELMPEGEYLFPDEEQLSDRPTRFFVAEMIREQLFLQLGDELPYSCAIEIEKFDENSKPIRIEALIHVERESQKGIVIGKGALKLKSIGQEARKQIEEFLGTQVFLGLRVKLLKDWTRSAEALKRMGYNLPTRKSA